MLTSEFEELSGRPVTEYEAANKLYMELPNLDKRDFCLLCGACGAVGEMLNKEGGAK